MKYLVLNSALGAALVMASTELAFAGVNPAPEVSATGSLAALAAVGAIAALIWERKKRR